MKILQVNKFFYPFGGSESYFFGLREILKRNGHEVVDFSMQDKKNLESDYAKYFVSHVDYSSSNNLVDKIFAGLRIIYSFEADRLVGQLIRDIKPEMVHLHNIYHQISPSILHIFKQHKLPVVMTTHDFKILCPNYQMFTENDVCERCKTYKYSNAIKHRCLKKSKLKSWLVAIEMYLHRRILKSYRKNIDMLIAPSEFMRNKFIDWGWDKDKIVYLPNFVDLSQFDCKDYVDTLTSSVTDFSNMHLVNNDNDYAIYFGRLSFEKGLETLIRAMALVKNDVKLKIVGKGPQKFELEKLAERLGVADRIEFLGFKSGDELYSLVANARFSLMPSIIYENNPLAVIESLALKTPVIGAKIGGIPELVIHQETGLNFKSRDNEDLAQKMDYAWENPETMQKWGINGYNLVKQNFNSETHYKKLMAIYRHVMENSKKA